jgi:hypothetical protein
VWTALQAAASPLGHATVWWDSGPGFPGPDFTRADDEIRTRDPHLGKVMRYHCATSALARIPACLKTLTHGCRRNQFERQKRVARACPASVATATGRPQHPQFNGPMSAPAPRVGRRPCVRPAPLARARQRANLWQDYGVGAIGAVGSALRSHRRGHGFKSRIAHSNTNPAGSPRPGFLVPGGCYGLPPAHTIRRLPASRVPTGAPGPAPPGRALPHPVGR